MNRCSHYLMLALLAVLGPTQALAQSFPGLGGGGTTVSGQVVDQEEETEEEEENPNADEGEVVKLNNTAMWVMIAGGIGLALLIDGVNQDSSSEPLNDCARLFEDLFPGLDDNESPGESPGLQSTAQADCHGRNVASLIGPLAFQAVAIPDAGAALASTERLSELLANPGALTSAEQTQIDAQRSTLLTRAGQPDGLTVASELPEYLMPGKTYDATFTVRAIDGLDLSQPLYLVASDLAGAGEFIHQLGYPFAVPVDMTALQTTGSWTYTTPYTAGEGGRYYLDALVTPVLPSMQYAADERGAQVIAEVTRTLDKLDSKLARNPGDAALLAHRAALQSHLTWLMEWDRSLAQ